jgi:type IV secretory pathway VirB10-like protein
VARNEDGEFELMLGNKQLLSVFFLMVLLLCLCFVGGYLLGRSAAPVVTAVKEPPPQTTTTASTASPAIPPFKSETPKESSAPAEETATKAAPPPTKTAPQASTPAPEPAKQQAKEQVKEAAKATPPPAAKQVAATAKQAPASSQPVAGRIYLQLSATDKDKAEAMVDLLRGKKFSAIAAPVAEKPGLFRVLVGPLAENALTQTKAQLKANSFPGDEAIRRVF